jgi:hypothetical protein
VVSDDTDQWISLVLGYPPGTISGTVTDADGVPVDGAEITVDGVVVGSLDRRVRSPSPTSKAAIGSSPPGRRATRNRASSGCS